MKSFLIVTALSIQFLSMSAEVQNLFEPFLNNE